MVRINSKHLAKLLQAGVQVHMVVRRFPGQQIKGMQGHCHIILQKVSPQTL
jgi:hypothetical protein